VGNKGGPPQECKEIRALIEVSESCVLNQL
jgi:hypothetical protein